MHIPKFNPKITKVDAAVRQLDTAIMLWFQRGDAISIHTLACSAYQILHDINQHRKGPELIFDSIIIKDEFRLLAKSYLKKTYNFLKHAEKDPDPKGAIDFNSSVTEGFIMFANLGLEYLGIKPNSIRSAFIIYQCLHKPELFNEKGLHSILRDIPPNQLSDILNLNRCQFFESYISLQKSAGIYRP
jgi:hypothetical protein